MRRQKKDGGVELFGNARYEGYCADLAAKICEALGIDYELRLVKDTKDKDKVKDTKYGEKMSNGTWNGMVGELTQHVRERDLFAKCRQPEGLTPIKAGAYYK